MIVSTPSGKIQGIEKDAVLQFRGIRYASAERFCAPRPLEPWAGVLDASAFGALAPQNPSPLETMMGAGRSAQSEDCLFLNIFTPALDGEPRPVLVWIHGGGFTAGSGSMPWYSGSRLAAAGDAVVVTINYRLGAFGFLLLDDLPDAANAGIRDQMAALEWVNANIGAFGGDPGNVTIFGESAGGMSVGTLLGTPAAAGLFHRAIAQSGAASNFSTRDQAAETASRILHHLDIRDGDAQRMLELDVASILAAQQAVGVDVLDGGHGAPLLPFCPVVDGDLIPDPPLETVRRGNAAAVPLLIGTTADEWNLFHVMRRAEGGMDDAVLARRVARILPPERASEAIDVYRAARPHASNDDIFCAIGTDMVFRIPAVRFAEAQSEHRDDTRMYLFSYPSTAFDGALGACHAVEIPFVFDNVDRRGVDMLLGGVDNATRALSKAVSRAWLAMARKGAPQHDGLPDWPPYSPASRRVMELGRDCRLLDDPGKAERTFWLDLAAASPGAPSPRPDASIASAISTQ